MSANFRVIFTLISPPCCNFIVKNLKKKKMCNRRNSEITFLPSSKLKKKLLTFFICKNVFIVKIINREVRIYLKMAGIEIDAANFTQFKVFEISSILF